MSNMRPQKWDWASHLPKMIALYEDARMSIPDIYKAIQCEGFEPCQRSVYSKFKSMGYPTDPVGRSKLLDAKRLPANMPNTGGAFSPAMQSPVPYTNATSHKELCPLPEEQMLMGTTENWGPGYAFSSPASGQEFHYTSNPIQLEEVQLRSISQGAASNFSEDTPALSSTSEIPRSVWSPSNDSTAAQHLTTDPMLFDDAFDFETSAMEINGADYFGIDTGYHSHVAFPLAVHGEDLFGTADQNLEFNHGSASGSGFFSSSLNSSTMEVDDAFNVTGEPMQVPRRSGSIDLKTPFQNFIDRSGSTGTRNRLRSIFRAKSGSSTHSKKKYATSQYTSNTQDSGYGSGFGSCLTLDDIRQINSQSLKEFNGLYRVACNHLHEPQGKSQCKDIATCTYCRYSSIHNLGWSSRYLKLEVFLSELRLDGVYNFSALDAAGNTALHYAAAGGASFRHLKALIDAGVNPYAANTSGELFIHCLRPIQPFTLEPNSDCLNCEDLISLLKLLDPKKVFDWRDNDGQTILHALCSKISEPELRGRILGMFKDAGYPPTVRDRFGRTAANVTPLTYDCHGQVIETGSIKTLRLDNEQSTQHEALTAEDLLTADWRSQQMQQIKAQNILLEARNEPNHTDLETNDNVLHALSRLKSTNDTLLNLSHFSSPEAPSRCAQLHNREGHHILLNLTHFVNKGVDLNLYNRAGTYPLKAFICERPHTVGETETGATLGKFIDCLLWRKKDRDGKGKLQEREMNRINVDMRDRDGRSALWLAGVRGKTDVVRSLIEAGASVNLRDDEGISILQAACNALSTASKDNDGILVHCLKEVISHLEYSGAVLDPRSLLERGIREL